LAARQALTAAKDVFVKDPNDPCANKFGDLELNRSQGDESKRGQNKFTKV